MVLRLRTNGGNRVWDYTIKYVGEQRVPKSVTTISREILLLANKNNTFENENWIQASTKVKVYI